MSLRITGGHGVNNYKRLCFLDRILRHFSSSPSQLIGQPTHESHPHLISQGQVTAGISLDEYRDRRRRLLELVHGQTSKSQHHVIVLPGSPRRYMIDKIPYLFRQDTDMLYMSGCLETDCTLVIHSYGESASELLHKAVMFLPENDPSKELWDGPRTSMVDAPQVWGVSEALPWSSFTQYFKSLKKETGVKNVWYHCLDPVNPEFDRLFSSSLTESQFSVRTPKPFIHSLRLVKSSAEIDLMKESCRISCQSLRSTMARCSVPAYEHTLAANVDYECRVRGAEHLAYPPVVAGGHRANIIHYIDNNNMVNAGEMVLLDAGCEFRGYSGDVTRTFPITGIFTPAQRELYEVVLHTQNVVIQACSARPTLDKLLTLMYSTLGTCLQQLCILPKALTGIQLCRAAFSFCPHHVSHYLGMDVHDTPSISKSDRVPANSVLTVEPGVYISAANRDVEERFRGIGIRIEDDLLIKETGVEVLTDDCPRHPDLVEKLVGSASSLSR